MSGLFPSIIYLSNKWLWRMRFFALLACASRGRSKLFVSLQLRLQIRMSLPAWRPMKPLFLSTGWLLYIIWKLGPLITSLCVAIHQAATATDTQSLLKNIYTHTACFISELLKTTLLTCYRLITRRINLYACRFHRLTGCLMANS